MEPILTAAERHYEAVKRASRAYYRRQHPNPKPRGRPRKVVPEPPKVETVVQNETAAVNGLDNSIV
jgi:hypothetical protein